MWEKFNHESYMNCLLVTNPNDITPELKTFLEQKRIDYLVEPDHMRAVQCVYESNFEIAIIDLDTAKTPVENTIRILHERNPKIRVLVCTSENSRDLEKRVRKESVYYYHLKHFGFNDFSSALQSALGMNIH